MSELPAKERAQTPMAGLLAGRAPLIPVLDIENADHAEPVVYALEEAGIAAADSCRSRPPKRDDAAHCNGMMPPGITR